jgi:hypothetical protein
MIKYQRGFVQGIGRGMAEAFMVAMIVVFIIGFILGIFSALGIPVIWDWLKPLIHGWTA